MLAYDSPPPAYPPIQNYQFTTNSTNNITPVYDARGRQKNYVESAMQRQDRIEFIKRREWARRVTDWVRETNNQKDVTTFGVPQRPLTTYDQGLRAQYDTASQASVIPFPRLEEEEPYIIYSSSPASSLSSLSEEVTPVLPLNSGPATPSLTAGIGGIQSTQRRSSGHHRRCSSASLRAHTRHPSLSSIRELPEED